MNVHEEFAALEDWEANTGEKNPFQSPEEIAAYLRNECGYTEEDMERPETTDCWDWVAHDPR